MDDEVLRTPPYLGYFDVSNSEFAWREPIPQQIERRRADLGDVLIFDILLSSGGIREPDTVFPPSDVESLVRLLDAIESSHYDALKKDCLVYFLLKWHQDGRESKFQVERCIPPQFGSLADAYWHLDTGINIPRAVSILSDARLNRDYASKIIHAISLAPNSAPLIVRYIRTAKPLLTEPDDLDIYILALAESSLREAWQFQRTFNETDPTRSRLLNKTIEWCLSPEPRSRPLTALLGLPLSQFEESLIHDYALKPPSTTTPSSVAVLRDLICVRLIQAGNYTEAIKIDHRFSSSTLNESKTHSQDRKKMVQDLYAALPLAERSLLDIELELLTQGKPTSAPLKKAPTISNANGGDISMSQSWEEVPRPSPKQPQNGITNGRAPGTASPFRDILESKALIPSRLGGTTPGTPTPSLAPIIPISSPTVNGSKPAPRKSFLLSSSLFPSTSSRPRQSLTQMPGQLFSGGNTSTSLPSAGGPGFPQSTSQPLAASTSSGLGFNSASRKQNAFYQPPPTTDNGMKRTFEGDIVATRQNGHPQSPAKDNDVEMDMDADHSDNDARIGSPVRQRDQEEQNQNEGTELGFSVFGNEPQVERQREIPDEDNRRVSARSARAKTPVKQARRAPPGAFHHSDEEEGGADDDREEPQRKTPPQRSRPSRSTKAATPVAKQVAKTRRVKDQDLGRTLPGSLMDEEEEEEEEDYVAPLRGPSPPKRLLRKARSSTASDLGQDETGVQTRRRSSRLSTAGSAHGGSPEPPSPKKATGTKTRKKGAAGTRRR